jgi:ABC-type bacteriocin/lantibiotic exporter with double-glycine peptidase domain
LHWDLNHFVVLVSVKGDVLTVHDPVRGIRRLSLSELSPHFTGVVLEFTPTPSFRSDDERHAVRLRALLGPVTGLCRALAQVLLLDEATSALDVERERAVNAAVAALKLTRIIVAHRPETIASADRVIVLVGGVVREDRPVRPVNAKQES